MPELRDCVFHCPCTVPVQFCGVLAVLQRDRFVFV
ncbi:unnamed protein product [Cyprideis torosa]|uniref:Uncharacterized protein n=1 Tax=Cyprideis torosa TaxID=163714 RepID=A0A7R8WUW6_9CRUS|nr:unnamed protein product [Cyprideis torosa]CAG0906066.1 unnamed protein product [Cyprideis torosa]